MRRVNEDDAARALWALDQNREAIASKAIRADVRGILAAVHDPDLKAGLETGV